jgi:hypothetical protein
VREKSHYLLKCIELSASGFSRREMPKVSLVIVFLLLLGTLCVDHETQSLFAWNTWVGKMML